MNEDDILNEAVKAYLMAIGESYKSLILEIMNDASVKEANEKIIAEMGPLKVIKK